MNNNISPYIIYNIPDIFGETKNPSMIQKLLLNYWFCFRNYLSPAEKKYVKSNERNPKREQEEEKEMTRKLLNLVNPELLAK